MGNCIKKQSSMQWGGEDWSLEAAASKTKENNNNDNNNSYGDEEEEDGLLFGKKKAKFNCPFSSNSGTEVKIKITKKQLEELVSKVEFEGLSMQQVLAQFMNVCDDKFDTNDHRSWRPALQSIPEVN